MRQHADTPRAAACARPEGRRGRTGAAALAGGHALPHLSYPGRVHLAERGEAPRERRAPHRLRERLAAEQPWRRAGAGGWEAAGARARTAARLRRRVAAVKPQLPGALASGMRPWKARGAVACALAQGWDHGTSCSGFHSGCDLGHLAVAGERLMHSAAAAALQRGPLGRQGRTARAHVAVFPHVATCAGSAVTALHIQCGNTESMAALHDHAVSRSHADQHAVLASSMPTAGDMHELSAL